MDFEYLFKLFITNIDNVNIGLITGVVSSIFISRIFMINSDMKEQFYRVQEHIQTLNSISAYLTGYISGYREIKKIDDDIIDLPERILDIIEQERNSFTKFYFEDLEEDLHYLTADNDDLIEVMYSTFSKKNYQLVI